MGGPQVVAVVELEEDEKGEEETGNPRYVCVHLAKLIILVTKVGKITMKTL